MTVSVPLRSCLITGEYPPDEGGVADYTLCLASALAERRVLVDVLTARRPGQRADRLPEPEETPAEMRGWVTTHRVVRSWGGGGLRDLRRALAVLRPHVVHIQYQAAAFDMAAAIHVAPLALRGRCGAVVVTYHDLRVPYLFPKAGPFRRAALRVMARLSDAVVTTNAADLGKLVADRPDRPPTLIPIGSNVPDAPPPEYDRGRFRRAAGIGDGTALVAFFGMLNESKGAGTLLQAVEVLAGQRRDVCLVMIGSSLGASDPTNRAGLAAFESEVERRSLGPIVRWTGHLPPGGVSAWLHAADVAALPYRDGASYRRGSLLAALEHGLPVVTTRPAAPVSGGLPADVAAAAPPELEDGVHARLVPPDEPSALAVAIASVLDDRDLALRLGRGARALSRAFGWPEIAARHVALYESLMAESRS